MQKDRKMIIKNKENLKCETGQAMANLSSCIAFVAMQEINSKNHYEFKKLNELYDKLENVWDYLIFCIDNDLNADISNFEFEIVRNLSDFDLEDYKTYYQNRGEFLELP